MTTVRSRTFEITATVTFPTIASADLGTFAEKLSSALGSVVQDYPTVSAFLIEPDAATGDLNYGLRFNGADPIYITEMADEILAAAVELVEKREGSGHIEAEREESVLVLTR